MATYNDFRDLKGVPDDTSGYCTLEVTENVSRIALCTLSAINLGNIKSFDDIEGLMDNAVFGLDNLLEYQDYLTPSAREATLDYRPLGVGLINIAYFFAKNNVTYNSQEAWDLMHDAMEAVQFYGILASVKLAKAKGPCRLFERTKYAQGLLPIDHYNKNVDEIVKPAYKLDWEWLRGEIAKHGMRNATITACMPAETSAKMANATNGVEPVRALVTVKGNKANISKQVVPEINRLKNKYDMLWSMTTMEGVIKVMAVIQKFCDQSISTNLSYNPEHFPDGKIPISVLLRDMLRCNMYGIKTLYYHNTRDGRDDDLQDHSGEEDEGSAELDDSDLDNEECDTCTI